MSNKLTTMIINPKTGISYINETIRNAGFENEVEYIMGPVTLVFLLPDADTEDIIKSLKQTIETIEMRQKYAGNANRSG